MAFTTRLLAAGSALLMVASCGSNTRDPDFHGIMDRTVQILEYTSQNTQLAEGDAGLAQVEDLIHRAINEQPALHDKPLGLTLEQDASFIGFNDPNQNNVRDGGETKLFTMEVDAANSRLVLTDETGQSRGMGLGAGLLAGAVIGGLLGRQQRAGVSPNRFAGQNVRQSQPSSRARSSSRSGGVRSGK